MELSYLGTSEKFPLQPNQYAKVALVSGIDSIQQSIKDILDTDIGTRFFNEAYGSYLSHLTFEQNDAILKSLLIYLTADALRTWEKRIKVIDVMVIVGLADCQCVISYAVLASNEIDSYTYPFYREIKQ